MQSMPTFPKFTGRTVYSPCLKALQIQLVLLEHRADKRIKKNLFLPLSLKKEREHKYQIAFSKLFS